MGVFSGYWYLPVNQNKCAAALNKTVSCQYSLYSGAGELEQDQKLVANEDITGSAIIKAFVATTITALLLSAFLILDKIKYHFFHARRDREAKLETPFYLQLIHTVESLLQTLSDQQLVAGTSLLVAVNSQACEISAYHFNLVCTMLILSAITHLNTLINIPDFIFKGKTVATQRLLAIAVQLALSGIVLSSRNTSTFPTKASALAVMPAACFENMNATDSVGFGDFVDFAQNATAGSNASEIWDNMQAATSSTSGLGEYITLVVFVLFSILFLIMEFIDALWFPNSYLHWLSIALSFCSVVAGSIITTLAMTKYNKLRNEMENNEQWYAKGDEEQWTYSQIVPILLLASGSITLVKAITESLAGHKARRYTQVAVRAANKVVSTKQQYQQVVDQTATQADNWGYAMKTY